MDRVIKSSVDRDIVDMVWMDPSLTIILASVCEFGALQRERRE